MECAYIDNLKAARLKERDGDLYKFITDNAIKNVGTNDVIVARNLKKKHVKAIIMKWLILARSNILHNVKRNPESFFDVRLEDSPNKP